MLDFLKEIVGGVADPSAGGTIDIDGGNADGLKRKRGKGKKGGAIPGSKGTDPSTPKRRRKKAADGQAQEVPLMEAEGGEPEGKSEQEDVAIDDADDYDENQAVVGFAEFKPAPPDEAGGTVDWREAEEDTPYMPGK